MLMLCILETTSTGTLAAFYRDMPCLQRLKKLSEAEMHHTLEFYPLS